MPADTRSIGARQQTFPVAPFGRNPAAYGAEHQYQIPAGKAMKSSAKRLCRAQATVVWAGRSWTVCLSKHTNCAS
jgi:hypothetical protein